MGFANFKALVEAQDTSGSFQMTAIRKVPSQVTVAGIWADLSMAAGNPVPNYYASEPLVAARLNKYRGIFHGGDVSPATKHLKELSLLTITAAAAPLTLILCDYLLYYPFVDMDSLDEQVMDNTVTLPRYTDGLGVKAMLVAAAPYVGGQQFRITYTNSDGTANRVSTPCLTNTGATISCLANGAAAAPSSAPFIPLLPGEKGIRSVQSITFMGSNGGLAALVLVKPLATFMLRETTAAVERDYILQTPSLPRIYDGAYLNFIALPNGSLATAPIFGTVTFVWS